MCAVSDDHTVGIDAERIDAEANFALLVPQVLSPHEASLWTAADVSSRAKRFHQLWALKESLLKAAGLGLRMAPSRISFELAEGSPPSAERLPEELGSVDDWSFFVSEPTPAHACALAVKAPSFDFARVEWREVSTEELVESALGRFDEVVLAGAAHASVNPTNSRVADRCL
jgi:4'-phosphopantetheinyl transferase